MMPLSLYIHIPWCVKKCPYCDFNSHKATDVLPEIAYIQALIHDLDHQLSCYGTRPLHSIFIGGGTPSLFSAQAYDMLFQALQQRFHFDSTLEITLEANPGTAECQKFLDYYALGINRLSIGIQSFHDHHLKKLGRIHHGLDAKQAIHLAKKAGFHRINLDLMHGLPGQTVAEGYHDLEMALAEEPSHLSWYQLTLEPHTIFYKTRPTLPDEQTLSILENTGLALLAEHRYERYETSAFAHQQAYAKHNLNYWTFGDYIGIGAGAHGKWHLGNTQTLRTQKHRMPRDYLNNPTHIVERHLTTQDLITEYMMNTSRLMQRIPHTLFTSQTGLSYDLLMPGLKKAYAKQLIDLTDSDWQMTPLGIRYANDLQVLF